MKALALLAAKLQQMKEDSAAESSAGERKKQVGTGDRSEKIFNGEDELRKSDQHIGMNNGLIVGYSAYDDVFLAYDNQCPQCFDYNALPVRNYPLSINSNGIAKCNNCKREFALSNEGNGMTRYRANTTGPFGILNVN